MKRKNKNKYFYLLITLKMNYFRLKDSEDEYGVIETTASQYTIEQLIVKMKLTGDYKQHDLADTEILERLMDEAGINYKWVKLQDIYF